MVKVKCLTVVILVASAERNGRIAEPPFLAASIRIGSVNPLPFQTSTMKNYRALLAQYVRGTVWRSRYTLIHISRKFALATAH